MPLLQIDIEARYAKFQDALSTIERDTKKTAANMSTAFGSVKATLAGLGAAVSVGALVGVVKTAIDAADNLDEMSKRTGVAVDVLGGLGFAAEQAGGSIESIGDVADKLNKAIAGAASGNKQFAEGFAALGIGIKDAEGNLKTVDQVLIDIADSFEKYADGPEKVAIAQRLMGKSGAEQIALLNEGGKALQNNIDYYKRYSGVTAQVAADAGQFNDTLAKVSLLAGGAGQEIAAGLLGPLTDVAEAFVEAREKSDAFADVGKIIGTAFEAIVILGANVAFTFRAIGTEIGGLAAQLNAHYTALARVATLDFKGAAASWKAGFGDGGIGDQMKEDAKRAREALDTFENRILNRNLPASAAAPATAAPAGSAPVNKPKPRAPILPTKGAGKGADDPSLRILDSKLKALERQSQAEQQLLASRSDFLQTYYQEDLLSTRDYYDGLRAAQAEALAAQEANINKEIALLRGRKPKDARENADNQSKIADLEDKKSALQTAAGREGIKLQIEQDRAAEQFRKTLEGINAELLEQRGLLPQAAAIRFDLANEPIKRKLTTDRDDAVTRRDAATASGDTAGAQREGAAVAASDAALGKLAELRSLAVAQGELNSLGEIGYRIQGDLSEATERAQMAADSGSMGELESLRAVSDARLQAAADLQQVATAFEAAAKATGNQSTIQEARALQLEVDKLAASADLVRERFEDAFTGPFESAIEKLVSGTASLKDVIKGLFSDISGEMLRMATRDFTKQVFSKEGSFGGIVDVTAGIFGGKPKAPTASPNIAESIATAVGGSSTVAAEAGMTALAATIPLTDYALSTLTLAADAAAGALASLSVSGNGGQAVNVASELFENIMFAKGGAFNEGNVIPFAKGGVPSVVSTPTYFPMKGGKTGLMGEAGPEAIMPLARTGGGELAITMVGDDGKRSLLPVMRDSGGRMAVRAQAQVKAFANGGVFGKGGSLERVAGKSFGLRPGMQAQPSNAGRGGDTHLVVQVTPPAGSSTASASQWGATAGRHIQHSLRRNG